jgi:hypothetical protein
MSKLSDPELAALFISLERANKTALTPSTSSPPEIRAELFALTRLLARRTAAEAQEHLSDSERGRCKGS